MRRLVKVQEVFESHENLVIDLSLVISNILINLSGNNKVDVKCIEIINQVKFFCLGDLILILSNICGQGYDE